MNDDTRAARMAQLRALEGTADRACRGWTLLGMHARALQSAQRAQNAEEERARLLTEYLDEVHQK